MIRRICDEEGIKVKTVNNLQITCKDGESMKSCKVLLDVGLSKSLLLCHVAKTPFLLIHQYLFIYFLLID